MPADELLKNKAHEPLPPVVIEESRMLKGADLELPCSPGSLVC